MQATPRTKLLTCLSTMSGNSFHWFVNRMRCFVMVVLLLSIPSVSHAVSFEFSYFGSCGNDIMCEGDAAAFKGAIDLNNPQSFRVGRVTYAGQLQLWDSSSGRLADFETHFSFTVDCQNCSDGLAFFLSPVGNPIPPNSHSGNLGLFNQTTGNQIVTVEFDTWQNEEYDPPGDDMNHHVGINVNSLASAAYDSWNFTAGQPTKAVITYNGTTKNLSVSWGSQFYNEKTKQISHIIDLGEVLPEWTTFGISAATGIFYEKHTILSWEFSSTLNAKAVTVSQKKLVMVLFGVGASVTIIILVLMSINLLVLRRKMMDKTANHASTDFDLERRSLPRKFNYQELVTATNGFSSEKRLGKGGTGQVYKGVLSDLGRIVAVKRIFADPENSEKFFVNELQIISRLIHKNLVQFVGWCHEKNEFLLVYDYMPNGSLDTHLYGNKKTIPWKERYKIALGLASALNYLHEDAEQRVLHRDIKSANVLLDTDYTCKLGDFGVAKLVDHLSRTTQMTGVVGTYGYLAPEYVKKGMASKESDIYSFGIVALEIASGRRSFQDGDNHIPLTWWVWQLYLDEMILSAADDRLNVNFDASEMKCLLTVGLWCTHPKDKERPKAGQVIKVLLHEAPLPILTQDMHDFDNHRSRHDEDLQLPSISTKSHNGEV